MYGAEVSLKSRASTRPSRRTRRRRTRPFARPHLRHASGTRRKMDADQLQPLRAHLEARDCVPDERTRCSTPWPWTCLRVPMARSGSASCVRTDQTLVKPGYMAVYQEDVDDTAQDETDRILPPMNVGDAVTLLEVQPRTAFHRAAAAVLRSLAGEGAGRARHRSSIDLCHHHLDAQGSRVRRHGQPPLHPDRHRQDRQSFPDEAFPPLRRSTDSPPRWRTRSMPVSRGEEAGCR